jgi:Protein of unknown function (DUF3478).
VFERWDGMSSGAAWEDLKVGMKNLTKWKRIALVTDLDWMITVTSLFGWMTPGELKRFPVAERDQAIAGLQETADRSTMARSTPDWEALQRSIAGVVDLPDAESYERASRPFNARFDQVRPRASSGVRSRRTSSRPSRSFDDTAWSTRRGAEDTASPEGPRPEVC